MKNYYDKSKEELVNEIDRLNSIILKQKQQIEKLQKDLHKRKKPGRKETPKDIKFQAYMLHGQGKSYREISKILGISIGTISHIVKGGLNDDKEE